MTALLEARALTRHFTPPRQRLRQRSGEDAAPVRAVEDISFAVQAGEVFGLLGQTGAGKTTLARLLVRLINPTRGQVLFKGQDLAAMTPKALHERFRSNVRLLFQHPDAALNPALTINRILDQALRIHTDLSPPARAHRAAALLDSVALPPETLRKHPRALSGGEKQRVCIARALATDPALLIADEPVAGLDVTLQCQILDLLLDLHRERGLTLVLIAHDVALLHRLCHRLGVMHAGRLVEIGPATAVSPEGCAHPFTRALFDARLTQPPQAWPPLPAAAPSTPPACPYQPGCLRWHRLGQPDRCLNEPPALLPPAAGHQAACHFGF